MEESEGKKMGEQGKNPRESKPQKMLAKLPPNYLELPPEGQKEWRNQVAQAILEHHRRLRAGAAHSRFAPQEL